MTEHPKQALVFLDTETTHLDPRLRRPWEIAMIRRPALPHTADRISIIISDIVLSDANPDSLAISGFYERHPHFSGEISFPRTHATLGEDSYLMPESEAAALVEEWTRDAIIIGLVPDFDIYTLDPMLRRHGLLPRHYYQSLDVETEAAGWLKGRLSAGDPAVKNDVTEILTAVGLPRDSDVLSLLCGVQPPIDGERHTAMGDARWAQRWWDAVDVTAEMFWGADA